MTKIKTTTGGLKSEVSIATKHKSAKDKLDNLYAEPTTMGLIDTTYHTIEDKDIKAILEAATDMPIWKIHMGNMPGAISYHHNYIGGLSDHVLEVIYGVETLCDSDKYDMDRQSRDFLVAGAMLHDFGKLYRYVYDVESNTIANSGIDDVTEYMHNGAKVAPCMYFTCKMLESLKQNKDLNEEKIDILIDLIFTHHGKEEWGSYESPFEDKKSNVSEKVKSPWILFASDYFSSCIPNYRDYTNEYDFADQSASRYDEVQKELIKEAFGIMLNGGYTDKYTQ